MYAVLGDIEFELITYFDGFEAQFAADYAEHPVIKGKPRLQWVGDALDEYRIELRFHAQYCDPEAELLRLRKALTAHEAGAFVLGDGQYKGRVVITDVQAISRRTDRQGRLLNLDARMTLREWVGQKGESERPPGVRTTRPRPQALTSPVVNAQLAGLPNGLPANPAAASIGNSVSAMSSARSVLNAASSVARLARTLQSNPVAALRQIPALQSALQAADRALSGLPPVLQTLPDDPAKPDLLQQALKAADAVSQAKAIGDDSIDGSNVRNRTNTIATGLEGAQAAMDVAAGPLGKLAAGIGVRR